MALSYAITTQEASEVTITVPFPFRNEEDVRVSVDDVLLTSGTDYIFNSDSEIQLTVAPTVGVERKVQRFTDITDVAAEFAAGAIDHRDLNDVAEQLLFAAQEAYDRSSLAGEGAAIASGIVNDSGVSGATVKDALDTLAAFLGFTTENAQDAIGSILTDTDEVDLTYNDTTPAISAALRNNSIVAARLKATTTKRLFGRRTVSSGAGEEVSMSQALDFLGSTQGQVIVRGSSGWVVLAPGTDGYVLTAGGAGVNPAWEASPAGYTDEQAQDAVGATLTDTGRINLTYDDGLAQLTADLVADSVTVSYMHAAATQRVFGRNTALAGAGEELTANTVLSWIGSTRGDILCRGASGWAALAAGTAGYLLSHAGPGADPVWVAPATAYTDEMAMDAIGAMLTDSTEMDFTYTDGSDQETLALKNNSVVVGRLAMTAQYRVAGRISSSAGGGEELTSQNLWTMLQQVAFTGGITASEYDNGTKSSSSWKPDPLNGNMQKVVNNGAHTLTPPDAAGVYTIIIAVTNGASAGAITTSGFTKVNGDTPVTTDTFKYLYTIVKNAVGTKLTIEAMQ